ncbi:ABC transporter permease [Asanoa siamensis]|uniref:Transport permease protein n=1 Tax=Asanoa siamensis TaxID=926357 RepID=A0ABQ4CW82_9ACTN|nr:ABC transporter permease [Asanoa siamensis]GIF75278.1 transport permease protein [Asanoa siamensis]
MSDATTMLNRNVKHTLRNPVSVFNGAIFPIVLMLMFVYVIGGAFDIAGNYVDYITPGMIILTICYGLSGTALSVNSDMTRGIINRFKVMDISRSAVLTAHVAASMLRSLIAIAVLVGVALIMGFRPAASFPEWLGAIGLLVLATFALSWITVALGLAAKDPESAGMISVPLVILPFLSSAIVPADTMATGVKQFADYQPFTPIIEALRGLLTGAPAGGDTIAAVAWCLGIALVGYVWSLSTFKKRA